MWLSCHIRARHKSSVGTSHGIIGFLCCWVVAPMIIAYKFKANISLLQNYYKVMYILLCCGLVVKILTLEIKHGGLNSGTTNTRFIVWLNLQQDIATSGGNFWDELKI